MSRGGFFATLPLLRFSQANPGVEGLPLEMSAQLQRRKVDGNVEYRDTKRAIGHSKCPLVYLLGCVAVRHANAVFGNLRPAFPICFCERLSRSHNCCCSPRKKSLPLTPIFF